MASVYSAGRSGHMQANGERHDARALTVASRTLPLGTVVRVENIRTKKAVLATVTDRGPYGRGRIVDLSQRLARRLEVKGTAPVRVTVVRASAARH